MRPAQVLWIFLLATCLAAQQTLGAKPPAAGAALSAEQMSKTNNPLSDLNGFVFENSYVPLLHGVPD
jgi:hypothetical protein